MNQKPTRLDTAPLPAALLALLMALTLWACSDDTAPTDTVDDVQEDTRIEEPPPLDLDPGATPITPSFDLSGDSFFDSPWPSDYRVQADGRVDLGTFPFATTGLVRTYVETIETWVDGYATMPVVYVLLDVGPGVESFPLPADTLSADAPIQLLDVSDEGCGERVPVEVRFEFSGDDFRPANLLSAAPVPGFPLQPRRPYALVVLRTFGAESNMQTVVPAAFEGVLDGTSPDDALNAAYQPLRDCLTEAGLYATHVAVATVFTTQDPVSELRAIRHHLLDEALTPSPTIDAFEFEEDASRTRQYATYTGTYQTPIYQDGDSPYAARDGGIYFDASGQPIVQRWEDVPFAVTYPTRPESGSGPFPVLFWSDGTGATLLHHVGGPVAQDALEAGFVVATFSPQFHDERAINPSDNTELLTFNVINPVSMRNVFRQQVADSVYFTRLIREQLTQRSELPELRTDVLVYGGQSQGAIVGAILAGVESTIDAYVLNGVGGYLSATIVEREDPIDIAELLRDYLGITSVLDRHHPIVALAQMGGEVADPINYAPYWRGYDDEPSGSSLLLINGTRDHTTPEVAMNAIMIAGATAPIDPVAWDPDPFDVWPQDPVALPIVGNVTSLDGSALTIGAVLSETRAGVGSGHFTIYDRREFRELAVDFWVTALSGTPELR